jgi:transmembrane sensor
MNDEMYNLLARHFSGQATAEEEIAVKNWIAENEQHKLSYAELSRMWLQTGESQIIYFDTDAAWKKVATAISPAEKEQAKVVRLFNWKKAVAIAAVLVALAGIWWIFTNTSNDLRVTADIDNQLVALEDGSKIYLRKGSSIKYPKHFKKDGREAELTGEAFFDIAKDPAKPFVLTADVTQVKVLGTSFLVNSTGRRIEVILKTGRVQFGLPESPSPIIMNPGDKVTYDYKVFKVERNSDPNFDAWQKREMVFVNTPLPEVAATLSHYYNVNVRLKPGETDKLVKETVTITFKNQTLENAISELELISSFHIKKLSETEYQVSSK